MKGFKKRGVLFLIGGVGYGIIEIVWRRRTHWTMILAGGVCAVLMDAVAVCRRPCTWFAKAGVCAAVITAVEFVFGLVFNKLFRMNVWDYSRMPLNFCGQICLLYSLLWMGLSMIMLPIIRLIHRRLC